MLANVFIELFSFSHIFFGCMIFLIFAGLYVILYNAIIAPIKRAILKALVAMGVAWAIVEYEKQNRRKRA